MKPPHTLSGHKCRLSRRMLLAILAILAGCGLGSMLATAGIKIVEATAPPGTIAGEEAQRHLQETNTVCGVIASTKYLDTTPGKPTYLNFDRPFPEQTCAAVVPGSARDKFKEAPEVAFKGKSVCVTGLITPSHYGGKPEIVVEDPAQIKVNDAIPPATTNQTSTIPGKQP